MVQQELKRLGRTTVGAAQRADRFRRHRRALDAPGLLAIAGLDDTAFARGLRDGRCRRASPRCSARACCSCCRSTGASAEFTLRWEEAVEIDWGIVLLYGGGLAMGELAFSTGLATAIGRGHHRWLPLAIDRRAHRALHGRRHRDVRGSLQHRVREHDRPGRDRRLAGRRRPPAPTGARRHARRVAWGS